MGGNRARSAGHADPAQPASKNAGRRRCRLVRVGCRDPDPAARRRLARAGRRSDALLETSSGAARRAVARGVTCRLWRYASKSEGSPPCPVFAAHDWPSRPDRLAGDKTRSRPGRLAPRLTAARLEHRSRLRALLGEPARLAGVVQYRCRPGSTTNASCQQWLMVAKIAVVIRSRMDAGNLLV